MRLHAQWSDLLLQGPLDSPTSKSVFPLVPSGSLPTLRPLREHSLSPNSQLLLFGATLSEWSPCFPREGAQGRNSFHPGGLTAPAISIEPTHHPISHCSHNANSSSQTFTIICLDHVRNSHLFLSLLANFPKRNAPAENTKPEPGPARLSMPSSHCVPSHCSGLTRLGGPQPLETGVPSVWDALPSFLTLETPRVLCHQI